jgi:molybdenum cofactor cytidylyltransferase
MSELQVFAVTLAAGSSSRFGSTKQLQDFHGGPLAGIAVRLATQNCGHRNIVVLGHRWREVAEACRPLDGFFVVNERHGSGIASSIRSGVSAVAHVADAVLLLLADQPLVTADHLASLIRQWRQAPGEIVASRYAGATGPPIVFPSRLFGQLSALEGDSGARAVVSSEGSRVHTIDFEPAAIDIDRPADLAGL